MRVENVPSYAFEDTYVVARKYDGEWWFWGSFSDVRRATSVAFEIGGEVFETATLI